MEHWSLAAKEVSTLTKSFLMGKFLQLVLRSENECLPDLLRECECQSDSDTFCQLQSEMPVCCCINHARRCLQEKETSLSPNVYALVTHCIPRLHPPAICPPVGVGSAEHDCSPAHPDFLLKDATLNWSAVETYIGDIAGKDFTTGGRKCAEIAHYIRKELFDERFCVYKELEKTDRFMWTHSPELFMSLLEEIRTENPLRVIISLLVGTAALERTLGDVYLSVSKATQCPLLLRDLLATRELEQVIGSTAVFILCCIIGPPTGLNLRNILWHGFVSHTEISEQFAYFLFVLISSLGQLVSSPILTPPLSLLHRPYTALSQETSLFTVFQDITKTDWYLLDKLICDSFFILPTMLPTWKAALDAFNKDRYDYCLVLLLPCLEHGLRRVFACVNSCSQRVLTAESTTLYTTFDEILCPVLPSGNPNQLISELGVQKIEMLLDVLVHPEGPRIRDRISHGEVDLRGLSKSLTNHMVCLCMLFCAHYSLDKDLEVASPISSWLSAEAQYISAYHPLSLLKQEFIRLISYLLAWKEIPKPDFAVMSVGEFSANLENIPQSKTTAVHYDIQQALQHLKLQDKPPCSEVTALYRHLEEKCEAEFIRALVDVVWDRKINTLFMDRRDVELISIVRRTVSNAEQAVCQIHETAVLRYSQYRNKQLRSRQRPNYNHLLSSLGLYQSSVVLLVVLSVVTISHISTDNQTHKLIKYQKKLLQFSENFSSQGSPLRNRWEEVDKLCQSLFELGKAFPS